MSFFSSLMKSIKPGQLAALVAAVFAAFAVREYLRSTPENSNSKIEATATSQVGDILEVEGTVLARLPRTGSYIPIGTGPLRAETIIQTQAASVAIIEFHPGPTLRLLENSRLVTEIDPTRDGALQATLLAGEVKVLNPGAPGNFTLLQDGVAVDYLSGTIHKTIPLIPSVEGQVAEDAAAQQVEERIEETVAEKAEEAPPAEKTDAKPEAKATPKIPIELPEKNGTSSLVRSTLTNDDIRTQVKTQSGGFQKCYVSMVNRMTEKAASEGQPAGALPGGETRVSFKILPSGKVEDARVVKSQFRDPVFERCMAEALGRLRFRAFQGAAIPIADFPIVLE